MIMQMEALECGAACLGMILAYFGKWIPLEQVRSDCGVSRDGSNAKNVALAGEHYGLKMEAFRYEPGSIREKGSFPCIIHWNFNHFVVLNGFRGNKAIINDPARGTVSVSQTEFDRAFTGVTMMFTPGEGFEPQGKPKSVLEFAKKRLLGSGPAVVFVVLTTIITAIFGVISPIFSRIFMDRLITKQEPEWVLPFLIFLFVFSAVQIIVSWIQTVTSLRINGKMTVVGKSTFLWQILRLPMGFFSQRMAGDISSRMNSNAAIAGTLVNTVAPLVINSAMMIFYLTIMLRYSILLSVVGIATVSLNMLVSHIISAKRVNITRVQVRDSGKLASATVSGIEMIETIKSSGAENGYFEKWAGYQASVNKATVSYTRLNSFLGIIPAILSALANTAVLIIGVALVFNGEFTIGMITAFQGFLMSFMSPAGQLIEAGQTIQEMRTDMERVEDVMEYPRDVELTSEDVTDKEYGKLTGKIELKNVTFGYSKLAAPLIEDFSMTILPGQRVAFVGGSGCGKSTLVNLISGLYKPWSGQILFDGIPIEEIDRNTFTGSVEVVDQDIIIFEDTIKNNIKMWDSSIEDFEMILAARDAQMHEVILEREGGYDYKLLEGGKDLSGGQRQRLEISRVLAADPTIIILDEATSALDAKTEYDVVNSIRQRGISCIVVAHRLSTIRDCDEIIVMDKGKVIERGRHEELFSANGLYTQLVSNE